MTHLEFLEKNGFPETNKAVTDLAESLAELKVEVINQSKGHIENSMDEEMSEAEKIVWNRQMMIFLLETNLSVTKALVEVHKNKLGGKK